MFFLKRFWLAFCPRKGYGQLMNAGIGGAFGVMIIMTLISGFVLSLMAAKALGIGMQMVSEYAKQFPPFKVEQGRLIVPNIPQPYVNYDKASRSVIVVDTTNRTTIDMVNRSYPETYKVLLTSDYVYFMPAGGKPTIISKIKLDGVNNSNLVEFIHMKLGIVLTATVWYCVILSIIGRSIIASILAGIMMLISVNGTKRSFKQTCGIVLHSMIPATLLQILTNAVMYTRLSQGNLDLSGLFFQAVGFTAIVLAMSLAALYQAEPENLVA